MVQQKLTNILNGPYPSDQSKRKDIIDTLCRKIVDSGVPMAITQEELYLSLDEAITNAMEHGNKWDPRKMIDITVTSGPEDIIISITDQGQGFDTREIEASIANRDILSNRGRGIYIINQFCKISWNKKGNQINLRIKRKA
jgi:anti-sigma regulatory factor (Ser/Thr protein kinase)